MQLHFLWLRLYILQLTFFFCNLQLISKCDFIYHNVTLSYSWDFISQYCFFFFDKYKYFLKLQFFFISQCVYFFFIISNFIRQIILFNFIPKYWGINRLKAKEVITCLHLVQQTTSKLTTSCGLIFCTLGICMTGFKTNTLSLFKNRMQVPMALLWL